ncbi:MAG: AsmA-like C-terminal region-containing protein [Rhodomicrobiaceae bacterium]
MRLKVPFYRFALGAVSFSLPLAIFIISLPYLINAEPVKNRFIKELQDWTGSPVELSGPVAIESFFSFALNAQNVEFKGFRGLPSLKSLKAERIVARLAWTDLLFGRLDFDKIKIQGSTIRFERPDEGPDLRALFTLLTKAHETPFEAFLLSDSVVEIDRGGTDVQIVNIGSLVAHLHSNGRIYLSGDLVWQGQPVDLTLRTNLISDPLAAMPGFPLDLEIESPLLTARFDGTARFFENWSLKGEASASVPDADRLKHWLGVDSGLTVPDTIEISGSLNADETRLRLEGGVMTTSFARAAGDLAVLFDTPRPKIEGSLAFKRLDLGALWSVTGASRSAEAEYESLTDYWKNARIDLGVSAKMLSWNEIAIGHAAFTLTGQLARLSAEIAHLDFLGGSMRGHVQTELLAAPPRLKARVTAEDIDAAALSRMGAPVDWLDGRGHAQIRLETAGDDQARLLQNARIEGHVNFPNGGQIRFDPAALAGMSSGQRFEGWNAADLTWQDFSGLQFKLALQGESLTFTDLSLSSETGSVTGEGNVNYASRSLDWRLAVTPVDSGAMPQISGKQFSIMGDWKKPAIRAGAIRDRAGQSGEPATPAAKFSRSGL